MDFVKDKLNTQQGQEFVKNAEQKISSGNSDKPSGNSSSQDKPPQGSADSSSGQHKYGAYVDKGADYIEKNILHKDKLTDSEKQYEAKAKDFINGQLDNFSK